MMKTGEDSMYDGEESRDTLLDASFDAVNTSVVEETPVVPEKPAKKVKIHLTLLQPFTMFVIC